MGIERTSISSTTFEILETWNYYLHLFKILMFSSAVGYVHNSINGNSRRFIEFEVLIGV